MPKRRKTSDFDNCKSTTKNSVLKKSYKKDELVIIRRSERLKSNIKTLSEDLNSAGTKFSNVKIQNDSKQILNEVNDISKGNHHKSGNSSASNKKGKNNAKSNAKRKCTGTLPNPVISDVSEFSNLISKKKRHKKLSAPDALDEDLVIDSSEFASAPLSHKRKRKGSEKLIRPFPKINDKAKSNDTVTSLLNGKQQKVRSKIDESTVVSNVSQPIEKNATPNDDNSNTLSISSKSYVSPISASVKNNRRRLNKTDIKSIDVPNIAEHLSKNGVSLNNNLELVKPPAFDNCAISTSDNDKSVNHNATLIESTGIKQISNYRKRCLKKLVECYSPLKVPSQSYALRAGSASSNNNDKNLISHDLKQNGSSLEKATHEIKNSALTFDIALAESNNESPNLTDNLSKPKRDRFQTTITAHNREKRLTRKSAEIISEDLAKNHVSTSDSTSNKNGNADLENACSLQCIEPLHCQKAPPDFENLTISVQIHASDAEPIVLSKKKKSATSSTVQNGRSRPTRKSVRNHTITRGSYQNELLTDPALSNNNDVMDLCDHDLIETPQLTDKANSIIGHPSVGPSLAKNRDDQPVNHYTEQNMSSKLNTFSVLSNFTKNRKRFTRSMEMLPVSVDSSQKRRSLPEYTSTNNSALNLYNHELEHPPCMEAFPNINKSISVTLSDILFKNKDDNSVDLSAALREFSKTNKLSISITPITDNKKMDVNQVIEPSDVSNSLENTDVVLPYTTLNNDNNLVSSCSLDISEAPCNQQETSNDVNLKVHMSPLIEKICEVKSTKEVSKSSFLNTNNLNLKKRSRKSIESSHVLSDSSKIDKCTNVSLIPSSKKRKNSTNIESSPHSKSPSKVEHSLPHPVLSNDVSFVYSLNTNLLSAATCLSDTNTIVSTASEKVTNIVVPSINYSHNAIESCGGDKSIKSSGTAIPTVIPDSKNKKCVSPSKLAKLNGIHLPLITSVTISDDIVVSASNELQSSDSSPSVLIVTNNVTEKSRDDELQTDLTLNGEKEELSKSCFPSKLSQRDFPLNHDLPIGPVNWKNNHNSEVIESVLDKHSSTNVVSDVSLSKDNSLSIKSTVAWKKTCSNQAVMHLDIDASSKTNADVTTGSNNEAILVVGSNDKETANEDDILVTDELILSNKRHFNDKCINTPGLDASPKTDSTTTNGEDSNGLTNHSEKNLLADAGSLPSVTVDLKNQTGKQSVKDVDSSSLSKSDTSFSKRKKRGFSNKLVPFNANTKESPKHNFSSIFNDKKSKNKKLTIHSRSQQSTSYAKQTCVNRSCLSQGKYKHVHFFETPSDSSSSIKSYSPINQNHILELGNSVANDVAEKNQSTEIVSELLFDSSTGLVIGSNPISKSKNQPKKLKSILRKSCKKTKYSNLEESCFNQKTSAADICSKVDQVCSSEINRLLDVGAPDSCTAVKSACQCLDCKKEFLSFQELINHDCLPFSCTQCTRYFKFQHQLNIHKSSSHVNPISKPVESGSSNFVGTHSCGFCGTLFSTKKLLLQHKHSCKKRLDKKCKICSVIMHPKNKHPYCVKCRKSISKNDEDHNSLRIDGIDTLESSSTMLTERTTSKVSVNKTKSTVLQNYDDVDEHLQSSINSPPLTRVTKITKVTHASRLRSMLQDNPSRQNKKQSSVDNASTRTNSTNVTKKHCQEKSLSDEIDDGPLFVSDYLNMLLPDDNSALLLKNGSFVKCSKCNKSYQDFKTGSTHFKTCKAKIRKRKVNPHDLVWVCTTCHSDFGSMSDLNLHASSCQALLQNDNSTFHNDLLNNYFTQCSWCSKCGFTYTNPLYFRTHNCRKRERLEKMQSCLVSMKKLQKTHIDVDDGTVTVFECTSCEVIFYDSYSYQIHRKAHLTAYGNSSGEMELFTQVHVDDCFESESCQSPPDDVPRIKIESIFSGNFEMSNVILDGTSFNLPPTTENDSQPENDHVSTADSESTHPSQSQSPALSECDIKPFVMGYCCCMQCHEKRSMFKVCCCLGQNSFFMVKPLYASSELCDYEVELQERLDFPFADACNSFCNQWSLCCLPKTIQHLILKKLATTKGLKSHDSDICCRNPKLLKNPNLPCPATYATPNIVIKPPTLKELTTSLEEFKLMFESAWNAIELKNAKASRDNSRNATVTAGNATDQCENVSSDVITSPLNDTSDIAGSSCSDTNGNTADDTENQSVSSCLEISETETDVVVNSCIVLISEVEQTVASTFLEMCSTDDIVQNSESVDSSCTDADTVESSTWRTVSLVESDITSLHAWGIQSCDTDSVQRFLCGVIRCHDSFDHEWEIDEHLLQAHQIETNGIIRVKFIKEFSQSNC